MKKSLIALAALAAAGAASAQSSVTLFGIVDASISRYVVTSRGSNNTVMSNSGYNSSRLGFRGTEDLGGGMSASFWLEGQLQNDVGYGANQNGPISGAITAGAQPANAQPTAQPQVANGTGLDFRRRSTVSLSGSSWGELRLGRDYTPVFWNGTVFDPFGTNGVGSNLVHKAKLYHAFASAIDPNYVRASNMIGYFLPANLGGVYGQVNYAFDEVSGGSDQGRFFGARVGFASGPFNVAAAFGRTDGTSVAGLPLLPGDAGRTALGQLGTGGASTSRPEVRDWNIGGQWDFGMAKLLGYYDRTRYDSDIAGQDDLRLNSWMIGTLVPVGAGEIRASYSRVKYDTDGGDARASQWAVGYVHNLSKRTALYTTYARVRNRGGIDIPINGSLSQGPTSAAINNNSGIVPVVNSTSWGLDLGIRHSF